MRERDLLVGVRSEERATREVFFSKVLLFNFRVTSFYLGTFFFLPDKIYFQKFLNFRRVNIYGSVCATDLPKCASKRTINRTNLCVTIYRRRELNFIEMERGLRFIFFKRTVIKREFISLSVKYPVINSLGNNIENGQNGKKQPCI